MENIELANKFKKHLKVLNRSPATVRLYTIHVSHFLDKIDGHEVRSITLNHIESWVSDLFDYRGEEGKPYKTSTIASKVRAIKRFFEYLEKENYVFINPTEHVKQPKIEKCLVNQILTAKEANKILDQPNLGTLTGIRDRTVLEVFYSTGIRRNELCRLTIYDADLKGGMVRINNGKGQKDRVVPMGKHAVKFLKEYIAKVRPKFTKNNRSNRNLFVDSHGKPLSAQVTSNIVKRNARAAKIKKQATPHTFRHTFATSLIKNNADIRAVQKMMGHKDIRTTQEYARIFISDVKKAHRKSHPREKDKITRKRIKPRLKRKVAKNEPK